MGGDGAAGDRLCMHTHAYVGGDGAAGARLCMHTHAYAHMHVHVHMHMHTCTCILTHTHAYAYMHMHTHAGAYRLRGLFGRPAQHRPRVVGDQGVCMHVHTYMDTCMHAYVQVCHFHMGEELASLLEHTHA